MDAKQDLFIPYAISSNNDFIQNLLKDMMSSYVQFKNKQYCKTKEKMRERDFKQSLSPEEQEEELHENLQYKQMVHKDDNQDAPLFEHLTSKELFVSHYDLIISALQVDLVLNYYRCFIKEGRKQEQLAKLTTKKHENVSLMMSKKMSLDKTRSFQESKKKLTNLQQDLQNAGRLETPQPVIKEYEGMIKAHANRNPYLMSLFYMVMAGNKKQLAEHKYLLL